MTKEQEPLVSSPNPLEILKGKNYVVAETFIIRRPINFSDTKAKEEVLARLCNQGVTGSVPFIFCNSLREQIEEIFNSLKLQKALSSSIDQEMFIVGFDAVQLQKMFQDIPSMIKEENSIMKGVDPKIITILQLKAPENTEIVNPRSRLKFTTLTRSGIYTPNSVSNF